MWLITRRTSQHNKQQLHARTVDLWRDFFISKLRTFTTTTIKLGDDVMDFRHIMKNRYFAGFFFLKTYYRNTQCSLFILKLAPDFTLTKSLGNHRQNGWTQCRYWRHDAVHITLASCEKKEGYWKKKKKKTGGKKVVLGTVKNQGYALCVWHGFFWPFDNQHWPLLQSLTIMSRL